MFDISSAVPYHIDAAPAPLLAISHSTNLKNLYILMRLKLRQGKAKRALMGPAPQHCSMLLKQRF
jgi:hypothetical protein